MGCASSKQKRCRHCRAPYSPVPKSYSMHVVHPPEQKGDSYHVVALTSTTLGSLSLDLSSNCEEHDGISPTDITTKKGGDYQRKSVIGGACNGILDDRVKEVKAKEFSMGLIEAKTWSNMIQEKIPRIAPRTPIMTPPGEPETINAWELMAGLEDVSPTHWAYRFRSFSFDVSHCPSSVSDSPELKLQQQQNGTLSPNNNNNYKSTWLQSTDEDDANAKCHDLFDPEVISTFRKTLEELSPNHPFYIKRSDVEISKQLPSLEVNEARKLNVVAKDHSEQGKQKVVLYFTSLRGVRKTYEDCCNVKVIIKGLGFRVDERDVSMHSGFKEELRDLLGEGFSGGGLPRVFVGSKYIGGAEEIRRMHEEGQLEKVFEGCEMVDDGGGRGGGIGSGVCEACGDIRFVPCETCSGSCKIYYEADEEEQEELEEGMAGGEYGFQRCPDCNENGLIRCPMCFC